MAVTSTDTLEVPGASLYHEVRGSGPVLLLIYGGVYDAAGARGWPSSSPIGTCSQP
jgi:hypothetical protein